MPVESGHFEEAAGRDLDVACAIYVPRVGSGPEVQALMNERIDACDAFIRGREGQGWWPVPIVWTDKLAAEDDSSHRPALQSLLGAVPKGAIKVLVVHSLASLWPNPSELVALILGLSRWGVRVVSVTEDEYVSETLRRMGVAL